MKGLKIAAVLCAGLATQAMAESQGKGGHNGHAPYAGLQARAIKSLSDGDISELRAGAGWGLALPAELSGRPGPAHLLELKDEIGLSPAQVAAIEALHAAMKRDAIAAAEVFIAAEAALSDAFARPDLDEAELRALVDAAARARADLRHVHLRQHLATPPLLTGAQIAAYDRLRGYAANPCDAVPEGHDATMWRRHNGCD